MKSGNTVPLSWRAQQLGDATDLATGYLTAGVVGRARALVNQIEERTALGGEHTVVAIAGATGSGKSTIFNALVGHEVAPVGVRRPTTDRASAAVWGPHEAADLLNWLDISRRHHVESGGGQALPGVSGNGHAGPDLSGLVLIDLPDLDSIELGHRKAADEVLRRADAFLWVADPQKYADARLHEEYLHPLREHQPVMLVAMNQIDRVRPADVDTVVTDLRRLVAQDGAGDREVLAVSARMQQGFGELRSSIAEVVSAKNAAYARLSADVRTVAQQIRDEVGAQDAELSADTEEQLVHALARAAGVPIVLNAVERDFRRQSIARAGWPFTRWLRALRPDPLNRLRVGSHEPGREHAADVRAVLGRSSLPPATPAARSAVQLATQATASDAAEGLPPRWSEAVYEAADPDQSAVEDALDQAVLSTRLRNRPPAWWPLMGSVQMLLAVAAVAGAIWLTTLAVLAWLQIPADAPLLGPIPVPLLMLVGGLVVGLLLAILARIWGAAGGRRRRRIAEQRLEKAIGEVARTHVRAPVQEVLSRRKQIRMHVDAAAR